VRFWKIKASEIASSRQIWELETLSHEKVENILGTPRSWAQAYFFIAHEIIWIRRLYSQMFLTRLPSYQLHHDGPRKKRAGIASREDNCPAQRLHPAYLVHRRQSLPTPWKLRPFGRFSSLRQRLISSWRQDPQRQWNQNRCRLGVAQRLEIRQGRQQVGSLTRGTKSRNPR